MKYRRFLVVLISSLSILLSGCNAMRNSLEAVNGVDFGTLNPPAFQHIDQIIEEGCAFTLEDMKARDSYFGYDAAGTKPDVLLLGKDCNQEVNVGTWSGSDYSKLAELGEVYSRDVCKLYFDGLEQVSSGTEFTKSELSLLLSSITALMGVLQTSADQLTVLAVTNTGIAATLDNSGKLYLFSPAPDLIYPAVLTEFDTYTTQHPRPGTSASYTDVHVWVQGFARTCTPERIRSLVDASMQNASQTGQQQQQQLAIRAAAVNGLRQSIGKLLNTPPLTDEQIGAIYWFLATGDGASLYNQAQSGSWSATFNSVFQKFLPPDLSADQLQQLIKSQSHSSIQKYDELKKELLQVQQNFSDIIDLNQQAQAVEGAIKSAAPPAQ